MDQTPKVLTYNSRRFQKTLCPRLWVRFTSSISGASRSCVFLFFVQLFDVSFGFISQSWCTEAHWEVFVGREPFTSTCCSALWRSSCSTASALTAHSLTSDLYWLAHQYTTRHLIPLYLSWTNGLLSAHRHSFVIWNRLIIQGQPLDFSEIKSVYLPETRILKMHHRCMFKDVFGVKKQVLLMLLSLEIWGDRLRNDRSGKATLRKRVYLGLFFTVIVERRHSDMCQSSLTKSLAHLAGLLSGGQDWEGAGSAKACTLSWRRASHMSSAAAFVKPNENQNLQGCSFPQAQGQGLVGLSVEKPSEVIMLIFSRFSTESHFPVLFSFWAGRLPQTSACHSGRGRDAEDEPSHGEYKLWLDLILNQEQTARVSQNSLMEVLSENSASEARSVHLKCD